MPQSLAQLYIHLVFSTKHREPWLVASMRTNVHSYMAEVSNNFGSPALEIGGVTDHVHVLARQSRTRTIAQWVEEMKTTSTRWIKEAYRDRAGFAWQQGYAAFSLSPSHVEAAREYVKNQEEHHRVVSFQDEVRSLFRKYGVEWNEQYVWD